MRVKQKNDKSGLKFNIQKTQIMASSPIISWQVERGKLEAVTDVIFLDSKITEDDGCIHGIKRRLLLERKTITNWDSILKSRDITLPTKVCIVKALVFLVVNYRFESWTIKKAEGQRIEVFELWCWKRHLRSDLDYKEIKPVSPKGNQPWIFIGRTDAEVKSPILWFPDGKIWLIGKDPDAGKDWRKKEKMRTEDEMVR